MDDVLLHKAAAIETCRERLRAVYGGDPARLRGDLLCQESILLNLQRATEAAIDIAMHVVRARRLGIPKQSREAFELLHVAGLVDRELADELKRMVGFRNVVVHAYQAIDLDVVERILEERLGDLEAFARWAIRRAAGEG